MKRNLNALASKSYDVVVIGGGIFGACIAHDAAARGLSVALFEKDDFGGATSYASMRVIHGGLRYLQSGNLPLMVNMKKEQHHWLQIAPHLIRSMPCLISTYDSLTKSKLAYTAALPLTTPAIGWSTANCAAINTCPSADCSHVKQRSNKYRHLKNRA
jgi:glycerol-3-phosphate dehydrogenase